MEIIKDFLTNLFSSRIRVVSVAMIAFATVLISRLFYLQIINGSEYQDNYNLKLEKTETIVECLGGEGWNKTFLNGAPKEEREKTAENIAKVRFFIDTMLGLKDRLALGPINDPIIGIDIRVGEIMSVTKHPKADSLMICNVNLGKRAITVVTNDLNVKEGNRVGVSLLPPQTFMDTVSEGMFLGMNGGILKEVEGELGQMPKGIPMESLNETRNLVEAYLD